MKCYIRLFCLMGLATSVQAQSYTLPQLEEAALSQQQLLKIRQYQIKEQESKVREAQIKRLPIANVGSTYQYNAQIGSLVIPAGSMGALPLGGTTIPLPNSDLDFELGKHHTFNARLSIYQPLTQLGKIKTGIQVAETDKKLAEGELEKAKTQIRYGIQQLYNGLWALSKRREEYQKNIEVAQQQIYDVEAALMSGKTLDVNLAGLKANLAKEEQNLLQLDFQEADYRAELQQLTQINFEILIFEESTPSTQNLAYYLQKAEAENSEIRLTRLQVEKAEKGIKAAQQAYLPDVGLIAGYTYKTGTIIYPTHNPFIG